MKTKEEKKKSNLWFMLLVLLLISVILCISSFGIATWARYRSVTGSNVEAQIAKWSFKVNGEEEQFADINLADTISFEHVENSTIAPGTYGSFDLDIDGRGSEVSLDYYVDMIVAQKPTNMKFYLDSNYSQAIEIAVGNKMYLEGDLLLSENPMQEIRTIYWKWDYRTSTLPSEAVLNAYSSVIPGLEALITEYDNASGATQEEIAMKINDKIDTQEAGSQVIVNVKVKGVQINPNFSLKRVQVTSTKDDVYQAGDTVSFSMEFTENVYGNNSTGAITSDNAPVVTVGFGGATANNPVAKVASLMQTNLKLSAGEKIATFVSASGNKINYSYTLKSGDRGTFRITSVTGKVYNRDGKEVNFGTVQSVPEVIGGTVTTEAPVVVTIGVVTPTPVSTPAFSADVSKYGQYIDIGTNILDKNNITLEDGTHPEADWRVFKAEENGIWLILASYLPQSKLPENTGLNISTAPYCVNHTSSRIGLLNGLRNTTNWKDLLNESVLVNNENVIVKGGFTIEEWISSWNENDGYVTLYAPTTENVMGDGLYGNYIGDSANTTNISYNVSSNIGFNNTLYFPHKSAYGNCYATWLDAPSAQDINHTIYVDWSGRLLVDRDYLGNGNIGIRPVVFIPYTVPINTSNSVWTVSNSTASTSVEVTPQINVAGQTVTLTKENAANYYGKVVTNYTQANATYRLFYVDFDGDFGEKGIVYLKADQVTTISLNTTVSASSETALAKMRQINPQWRDNDGNANENNELGVLYLCDENNWSNYKDGSKADWVIGAPSIEMYIKSYNQYHTKKQTIGYQKIICDFFDVTQGVIANGYQYVVGENNSNYVYYTENNILELDENNMYVKSGQYWWFASPSAYDSTCICSVDCRNGVVGGYYCNDMRGVFPIVSLKSNFTPEISN